jgi:hypothetical protein
MDPLKPKTTKPKTPKQPVEATEQPVEATEQPEGVLYVGLDAHFGHVEGVVVTDRYLIEYRKLPSLPGTITWHVRVALPSDPDLTRPLYVRTVVCDLDTDGLPTELMSFGEVW